MFNGQCFPSAIGLNDGFDNQPDLLDDSSELKPR